MTHFYLVIFTRYSLHPHIPLLGLQRKRFEEEGAKARAELEEARKELLSDIDKEEKLEKDEATR